MGYRLKKSQENVKVRLEVVGLSDVGSVRFCLYGRDSGMAIVYMITFYYLG